MTTTQSEYKGEDVPESWKRILTKYGVTGLLAIWGFYIITGDLKSATNAAASNAAAAKVSIDRQSERLDSLIYLFDRSINVQLQQCLNSADDVIKRERCFDAMQQRPQERSR